MKKADKDYWMLVCIVLFIVVWAVLLVLSNSILLDSVEQELTNPFIEVGTVQNKS